MIIICTQITILFKFVHFFSLGKWPYSIFNALFGKKCFALFIYSFVCLFIYRLKLVKYFYVKQ